MWYRMFVRSEKRRTDCKFYGKEKVKMYIKTWFRLTCYIRILPGYNKDILELDMYKY